MNLWIIEFLLALQAWFVMDNWPVQSLCMDMCARKLYHCSPWQEPSSWVFKASKAPYVAPPVSTSNIYSKFYSLKAPATPPPRKRSSNGFKKMSKQRSSSKSDALSARLAKQPGIEKFLSSSVNGPMGLEHMECDWSRYKFFKINGFWRQTKVYIYICVF